MGEKLTRAHVNMACDSEAIVDIWRRRGVNVAISKQTGLLRLTWMMTHKCRDMLSQHWTLESLAAIGNYWVGFFTLKIKNGHVY